MLWERIKAARGAIVKVLIIAFILVFFYFYGQLFLDSLSKGLFGESGSVQPFLPVLFTFLSYVVGTEIFLLITRYFISHYLENRGKKKEIKLILTLYTYLVWGFVGMFLISIVFKDLGAILTSIGLIGFGITFALQKPILNFVGWLTIVITKPFNIGDRIEVTGIRGDVLGVHTMYTTIQGLKAGGGSEKTESIVTVPNEVILTNAVINYSRRGNVFVDEVVFSITYESNYKKAIAVLETVIMVVIPKYLKNRVLTAYTDEKSWHEAMDLLKEASKKLKNGFLKQSVKENIDIMKTVEKNPVFEVPKPTILMGLGDSSVDISAIYQTDLYSVRATKNEIITAFFDEVQKHNDIEFAYPHMQLVYDDKTKRKRDSKQRTLQ